MADNRTSVAMDHKYIEDQRVADRYLDRSLPAAERTAFEKHFVDCPECLDRLALAEIFRDTPPRYRDVPSGPAGPPPPVPMAEPIEKPAARAQKRQTLEIAAIFATAALLFMSVPAAYFLWQWSTERQAAGEGPSAALYALTRGVEKTIRLGAQAHPVVFSVDLAEDPAAVAQRVSVLANDKQIWSGTLTGLSGAAPGILVPSRVLPTGQSTLRIEAKQPAGDWRVIAEFALNVVRSN